MRSTTVSPSTWHPPAQPAHAAGMKLNMGRWTLFAIIFVVLYIGISLDEPGDGKCNPVTYVCGWVILIMSGIGGAIRNVFKG